ncbi:MAG TPA: hypothetical protein VNJ09_05040 [Chthonomonadales bacterium]|nr:hypothetical protein [Chthonomonadales bacterium]
MKDRAVIGIEIAGDEIRGAFVQTVGGNPVLAGVASAPTPQGSIDADGMLDAAAVGEAVRRVCAQLDPRSAHVVVGMTGCAIVARVMEIPPVPDPEVRAVLRGEMDHYRILPEGQSAFDFYRLPALPGNEQAAREETVARVLLMGAEERLVTSYRAAIDASGRRMEAIEPGSIAVLRALYPILRKEEAVAMVVLSTSGTDIFITDHGNLQFYRRVDTGLPELFVQDRSREDTATPTMQRPLGGLLVQEDDALEPLPASSPEAPDRYNRQAISLLMTEVQRSIDYYKREFTNEEDQLLVRFAIDTTDATELFSVLTQYLRSQAEMASALETLEVAPEVAPVVAGPNGFKYTVAVGLALRGFGGKYAGAPAIDLGVGDRVIVERRSAPKAFLASVAASSLIFIGTITAAVIVGYNISRANRMLAQAKTELNALTKEHAEKVARLDRQKKLVEAIRLRNKPVRESIDFLAAAIAQRAALKTMDLNQNGMIYLSGEAPSPRVVADIMDTINLSPVLEPIRLNNIAAIEPEKGGHMVQFDLQTGFLPGAQQAVMDSSKGQNASPTPDPAGRKLR